jgi:environmental stress-induced protein Ves
VTPPAERTIRVLGTSDARVVRWRNGRGVTRELAAWPAGSGDGAFDWRLSIATVSEPGEFSGFPGVERILTVLRGEALVLTHGEVAPRVRLRRLEPHRFAGEWPTVAELPTGPIEDFNVMTRIGRVRAEVEALRLGRRIARERLEGTQAFVHVPQGSLSARVTGEEEAFELAAHESLLLLGLGGGEECELRGTQDGTEVLLVRLLPGSGTVEE